MRYISPETVFDQFTYYKRKREKKKKTKNRKNRVYSRERQRDGLKNTIFSATTKGSIDKIGKY